MNKVILVGRLTKEPELRGTQTGKSVASFTLAVDSGFGDNKKTDFIPIVVWGNPAEFCAKYLTKGSKILVDGKIQVRNYDNKEGKKVYVTEVIAFSVEGLDNKKQGENAQSGITTPETFGQDVDLSDEVPF